MNYFLKITYSESIMNFIAFFNEKVTLFGKRHICR